MAPMLALRIAGGYFMLRSMMFFFSPGTITSVLNYPLVADYDRRTALHLSAAEGKLGSVRLLVDAGATLEFKDRWGVDALIEAVKHDQYEVAKFLVARGASPAALVARLTRWIKARLPRVHRELTRASTWTRFERLDERPSGVHVVRRSRIAAHEVARTRLDQHVFLAARTGEDAAGHGRRDLCGGAIRRSQRRCLRAFLGGRRGLIAAADQLAHCASDDDAEAGSGCEAEARRRRRGS